MKTIFLLIVIVIITLIILADFAMVWVAGGSDAHIEKIKDE